MTGLKDIDNLAGLYIKSTVSSATGFSAATVGMSAITMNRSCARAKRLTQMRARLQVGITFARELSSAAAQCGSRGWNIETRM